MDKKLKLSFAPGCFDNFEGTQEELNEMIGQIREMFANMTPEDFENHPDIIPLDIDDIIDDKLIAPSNNTRH